MLVLDRYAREEFHADPDDLRLTPLPIAVRTLWSEMGGETGFFAYDQAPPGWHRVLGVKRAGTSQFDTLSRLLGEGDAPSGPIACFAMEGCGFHGHRGRPWTALRGNVHLSVAFTPKNFPARHALAFVVLPAVATLDAVRQATNGSVVPEIKWVNDLLVDGAKLAGVLTATASEGDRLSHAVLGIGLNVEQTPEMPGTPFVPAVTSLADLETGLRHRDLLGPLLKAVITRYEELLTAGPKSLIEAYRGASGVVGREVVIYPEGIDDETPVATWPEPISRGRVVAIGDDLSLSLAGVNEPVARGRLRYLDEPDNPGERAIDLG